MKYLLIFISLFSIIFLGCNKEDNPIKTQIDNRISFEINFLQYSDNNYFLDKVYADTSSEHNIYNHFYGNIPPIVSQKYFIKNIEVYKSINNVSETSESIIAHAYIDLPPRSSSKLYSDSYRSNNSISPGKNEVSRVKLLNKGTDYIFHLETGYITLLIPVNDMDIIAVAYKIENNSPADSDDIYYGEFISELVNSSKNSTVLKLIKPSNIQPAFKDAWKLKMKNIYQVASSIEQITNLDFDIYLKKSDGGEVNEINNVRLMNLFGFDKINEEGTSNPDGKFDDMLGINYEPRTGEIIFPVIQPFGINIPFILKDYKYEAIYDTIKSSLSLPGNSFIIKGKYKPL